MLALDLSSSNRVLIALSIGQTNVQIQYNTVQQFFVKTEPYNTMLARLKSTCTPNRCSSRSRPPNSNDVNLSHRAQSWTAVDRITTLAYSTVYRAECCVVQMTLEL